MSMLEKMARQLATDALERVKPGTYTNVVEGIGLYQMLDGNYQVGELLGAGDEDAPGISYNTAREAMVAMMAGQAGALVVVPEDAPMDSHLVQIAQLLVASADVPTDAQDVADAAAIVQTVKTALDWLATARTDKRRLESANISLSDSLENINAMLVKSPDIALGKDDLQTHEAVECGVGRALRYLGEVRREAIELRSQIETVKTEARQDVALAGNRLQEVGRERDQVREQLYAAQQEIGALTAKLEEAKRSIKRNVDEAANCQARYEGLRDALHMAMDKLAGVGK